MSRSNSQEYVTWRDIHRRCENSKHYSYHLYGGRGIKVCPEWATFEAFLADVGKCPRGVVVLARRDLDKDYGPGNCLWAPPGEYPDHRKKPRMLTYKGVTKALPEWAEKYRLSLGTLTSRVNGGWSVENALLTPVNIKMRHKS